MEDCLLNGRLFGMVHLERLPGLVYRVTHGLFNQRIAFGGAGIVLFTIQHNFKHAYASDGRSITRAQRIISVEDYRQQMNQARYG
jgi:hypothetical protein